MEVLIRILHNTEQRWLVATVNTQLLIEQQLQVNNLFFKLD